MNTPSKYRATMLEDLARISTVVGLKLTMLVATSDTSTLRISKQFSQTFPSMLLRLVGTADSAGDCEGNRRLISWAPNNMTQSNVSQMDKASLVFRYVPVQPSHFHGVTDKQGPWCEFNA